MCDKWGGSFFFLLCWSDVTGNGQILDLTIKVKAYVQKKKKRYSRNNKMHRRFVSTPQNEKKRGEMRDRKHEPISSECLVDV